ncbi:ATP-dependent Clp protease adaptor ClpS [Marinigracilibium pacificum]|uniref:ATP-dependent Clp protease adaptor ClpS n=1 Tax=Marinigracilibium pacificum TaxID=2729599 RepID=A0A848IZC7_9BACT|nr:ATP-dependent Clp protease adaptor ClpS [Marinigracilibium pacificum]NMM48721.1 ATP-dependent Clp protease adaptor ClpS [Marinigracilibium pacificum]
MRFSYQEETIEDVLEVVTDQSERNLMVYNDDFNTFEHVINTLIKVCKHNPTQAEQCTYIIHYKGKCSVKSGTYEKLKPMRNSIREAGIDAKIV